MSKTIKIEEHTSGKILYAVPTGIHASLPGSRMHLIWHWDDSSLVLTQGYFLYETGNIIIDNEWESDTFYVADEDFKTFQGMFD